VGVRPGLPRDQQGRAHLVNRSIRHQRGIRWDIMASREDPLSLHLDDHRLNNGHLIRDYSTSKCVACSSSSVTCSSSSLGPFNIIDWGSRPVGHCLLLWVPGLLGQRRGVGRVGSHTTSATVLWRGPERLDQSDPL
jgi:hypothetical protein